MINKPYGDTRMAKYVERRVLELKPTKSQAEIAAQVGYVNPNMITMIKQGGSKVALDREAALSDYVVEWAGGPVKSIKKGFKAAAVAAGLPDVSPHVLRHTAAVHMAEAGTPMDEIAQFLGHSASRITASVYARYSPEHLRKAANALEFD